MNEKRRLRPVSTLWLGAINGLLAGLALEKGRVAYLNHQMDLAAREYAGRNYWADFTTELWDPFIPFVSVLVFAVVSFLVRKYLMNRPRLLLYLWLGLEAVALGLGYFMSTLDPDLFSFLWLLGFVAVTYLVHRLWKAQPDFQPLFWALNGISALVVVAPCIQLVGLFFYWPNLRRPFFWLVCLLSLVAISSAFGAVVQFFLNRINGTKFKEANAQ